MAIPILGFSLSGCGDSSPAAPEPPAPSYSMAGAWEDPLTSPTHVFLDLILSDQGGAVSGSGTFGKGTELAASVVVSGTRSGSSVSLTVSVTGFTDMNITGTLVPYDPEDSFDGIGPWSLDGTVNGSGFAGEAVRLVRAN